ncbi:hypothetical protein [Celeribacter sp.]|uniref:hypothetical protein n=1 Tax=Celeribacter sp. TaxID=1890673 RepID=UPI003A8CE2FB
MRVLPPSSVDAKAGAQTATRHLCDMCFGCGAVVGHRRYDGGAIRIGRRSRGRCGCRSARCHSGLFSQTRGIGGDCLGPMLALGWFSVAQRIERLNAQDGMRVGQGPNTQ